jgi:DNA invertase Pin-like site-specific DNA recombinase
LGSGRRLHPHEWALEPTFFGDCDFGWCKTDFSLPVDLLKLSPETPVSKSSSGDEFLEKNVLVGYARVTTQDQKTELQIDALSAVGCERIFVEKASGAQRDRPELKAALEYVRAGDTIVVWKLDRLARSLKQLIETVDDLQRREVGFRSLTEAIDTTTGGRLIFHIFAALAEFERSIIRERTVASLAAARARGRKGGRPPSLTERDLQIVRAILQDKNLSVAEIAAQVGVTSSTLYRYIPAVRTNKT